MQTSIREIPEASEQYNSENDYVMIHNLSRPINRTTQKQKIKSLVEKFSTSKIRLIKAGFGIDLGDITFETDGNELIFIKIDTQHNDADVYDGFKLYLFNNRGAGKFKGQYVSGDGVIVDEGDFILIDSSFSIKEIITSSLNKLRLREDEEHISDLEKYLEVIEQRNLTIYDQPIINLSWRAAERVEIVRKNLPPLADGTEDVRQDIIDSSFMHLLEVKLNYWNEISNFINRGGKVNLLIYRKRNKVVRYQDKSDGKTKKLGRRWSLNKKAERHGGAQTIPITKEKDFYDIRPEFLLKDQIENPKSYIDKLCNIKRTILGFGLKFELGEQVQTTSILKELDLIMYDEGLGNGSGRTRIITFRER